MGYGFAWEYRPVWTYHGVWQYPHLVRVRRCDFCKADTTADDSDTCRNCLAVFQGVADHWNGRGEDVAQLLRKWPPTRHSQVEYGRPWQDHVPNHSKHLIKDRP